MISKEYLLFPGGTAIIKRSIQAILDMMEIFGGRSFNFIGFQNDHEEEIVLCYNHDQSTSQEYINFILDSQTLLFISNYPGTVAVFELEVNIRQIGYSVIFYLGTESCSFSFPHKTGAHSLKEIHRIPEFYDFPQISNNPTVKELFVNASLKQIDDLYYELKTFIPSEYLDLSPIKRWIFDQKPSQFPKNSEKILSSMTMIHFLRLIRSRIHDCKVQFIQENENFLLIKSPNKRLSLLNIGVGISDAFLPIPKYVVKSRYFHFSRRTQFILSS